MPPPYCFILIPRDERVVHCDEEEIENDKTYLVDRIALRSTSFFFHARRKADLKERFHGTIFICPDVIRDTDPSATKTIEYIGMGNRSDFDRRVNRLVEDQVHVLSASFDDSSDIEVHVNKEFNREEAITKSELFIRSLDEFQKCFEPIFAPFQSIVERNLLVAATTMF